MVAGGKQQVAAHRNDFAAQRERLTLQGAGGREPPAFIELPGVWQEGLGHHAQDPALVQHRRGVVETVINFNRQADDDERLRLGQQHGQFPQSSQRLRPKADVHEQIGA